MTPPGSSGSGQLLCRVAILAALAGVLALTGSGGEAGSRPAPGVAAAVAPEAGSPGSDPEELARVAVAALPSVARRVERIRDLEFERLPRPRVVTSSQLNRIAARDLRREDELRLATDEAAARILGLQSTDEQLEAIVSATGDLAAAAYDTERDRLYVVEDAVGADRALVEFLLAHELTHALEDEAFGLPEAGGVDDDGALARLALSEGTATAVMVEYGAEHLSPLALLEATGGLDEDIGAVPEFVVDQLTWAYLGGSRFVNALRDLAGGWKLVDYALSTRPPASTEQVLHPRAFVRDQRPARVRIAAAELRRRGWRPAGGGVLGELGTAQLLRLGVPQPIARRAAVGWDGDRYLLWRRGRPPRECEPPCRGELILVVRWSWDSRADERDFARAAAAYVVGGLGGTPAGARTWEIEDGSVALRSGPTSTALAFAPEPATARAAAEEQVPATGGEVAGARLVTRATPGPAADGARGPVEMIGR